MLGLKLNHVSKRGHWGCCDTLYLTETHFILKSGEILFLHHLFRSFSFVLKFGKEHAVAMAHSVESFKTV